MRIPLLTKFFFSFLLTGIVLVAILIGLIQFYAFKNFSDYVAGIEYNQLDALVEILDREFREKGSFTHLKQNHFAWITIMAAAGLTGNNPPPDEELSKQIWPGSGPDGRQPPFRPGFTGPPPQPGDRELGPRVVLLDKDKTLIMGRRFIALPEYLRPIPDKGDPVGFLGFDRAPNLSHPMDLQFLKQQTASFYLAGGLFLICSVLVSFVLAFHLLSPIRKLSRATRALGRRKFDTRIHLNSGDELGQLAEDFNWLATTLGDYERRQTRWLSDISHELRTPLSILQGELEAVQDGIRELDAASVNSLHAEVSHLIRLVNDLNDLSMAEAGMIPMTASPVDVAGLLAMTLERFRHQFEYNRIHVEVNVEKRIMVQADPDRLVQVFSNLLKNALTYSDRPGRLRITCLRHKNQVGLAVENSGPGVPAHLHSRLFDRLFRVEESRNRKQGGSGLGLAICKHIILAHGGKIKAAASDLGGLGIEIKLPALGNNNAALRKNK